MYSVRQIVALYRIHISTWRGLSIDLLNPHADLLDKNHFEGLLDPYMIEAVIQLFSEALQCRLGYRYTGLYHRGRYGAAGGDHQDHEPPDRDGFRQNYRSDGFYLEAFHANELEHALVHIVNMCRLKIDIALRAGLVHLYEEWKEAEDEKKIPENVVF